MAKKYRYSPSTKKRRAASVPVTQKANPFVWVAAVLEGCQDIAREEMGRRLRQACVPLTHRRRDEIHFRFAGEADMLLGLRTVQSLFLRRDFSVQRPRTLRELHGSEGLQRGEVILEPARGATARVRQKPQPCDIHCRRQQKPTLSPKEARIPSACAPGVRVE